MKTKEELKEMIEQARELGVESLEVDGVKYTLRANFKAPNSSVEEMKPEEIVKPLSPLDELTDEEILYWATPFYDHLQSKKEAQSKQKQEEDELRKAV